MKDEPKSVKDLSGAGKATDYTSESVKGHDFSDEMTLSSFINSFKTIGFQATNISLAIEEINRMKTSKIFIGCTSNIISSGLRELVRHIAQYKLADVMVITGGGIEEDITKVFLPHLLGSFTFNGHNLRETGLNRIGNIIVPNENYFALEKWLTILLNEITEGYTPENPLILTPSKFIKIMGEKINNKESILYWAACNGIRIYSPALIDGSIGDIITFYERRKCFKLDTVEDIYNINRETFFEKSTGAIILGGGLIKHHILNANLFKDGLDHCVLVNTASEFDGSDAGASLDEAVSWGKLIHKNTAVKIFGDATVIFPILMAGSFLSKKSRD